MSSQQQSEVLDISDTPPGPPPPSNNAPHIVAQEDQYKEYQQKRHQQYRAQQQQHQYQQQQLQPTSSIPPPPPPPDEFVLPPGWQTATRAPDGRLYYYHTETGQTTWEYPGSTSLTTDTQQNEEEDTSLVDGMITGADGMMARYGYDEYRKYLPKVPPKPATTSAVAVPVGAAAATKNQTTNRNANETDDTKEQGLLESVTNSMREYQKKPNNNTCLLIMALLCCLPLGCCALMHRRNADRNYYQGNYGGARTSSTKATNYSGIACVIGIVAIIVYGVRNDWTLPPFLEDLFDF